MQYRTVHLHGQGGEQQPPEWDPASDPLHAIEVRVLGCLIEKESTTPEYYPLTLNALVAAANQKTSRDPVMSLTEDQVKAALESLRRRSLLREVLRSDSRVTRYRHVLDEALGLNAARMAVLCVLMLRGAQTAGEIRGRTGRMQEFVSIEEVDEQLASLEDRSSGPLVTRLPIAPGSREPRYAHLLAGPWAETPPEPVVREESVAPGDDRVQRLEDEVAELRSQLEDLAAQFAEFRKSFE